MNTTDTNIVGQSGEPGQGPWMRLLLQFDGEKFTDAKFETYGCPTALRCGDWMCRWLVGRVPEVREHFYAISNERKIKHPAVEAILSAVHKGALSDG